MISALRGETPRKFDVSPYTPRSELVLREIKENYSIKEEDECMYDSSGKKSTEALFKCDETNNSYISLNSCQTDENSKSKLSLFASQLREKDKVIFRLHKERDRHRAEIEKLNMQLNIEEKIKKLEAEKEIELLV